MSRACFVQRSSAIFREPTAFLLSCKSAMDRQVRARVGAARLLLQDLVGSPSHAVISHMQCAATCAVLEQAQLSAENRADMATTVLEVQWHGQDLQKVLAALSSDAGQLPRSKRRRSQQSFEALVHYCTEEDWAALLAPGTSTCKAEAIVNIALGLGLRCPSEPTIKYLCSWWMVCSETEEELLRIDRSKKTQMSDALQAAVRLWPQASHRTF